MTSSAPANELEVDWISIDDECQVCVRDPLDSVKKEHAVKFHNTYGLPVEEDVFIRGVLAVRSQNKIEEEFKRVAGRRDKKLDDHLPIQLKIGNHKYSRLETEVLYNAWTRNKVQTLKNLGRLHWLLIVACIYAAITQGWDQAAMAGAALQIMSDLGKPTQTDPFPGTTKRATDFDVDLTHNAWLLGLTIGVPFFAGAILGPLVIDPIVRTLHLGRRGATCTAAFFCCISVIGSGFAQKWYQALIWRILLGIGMAGKAAIVPILLSETSPKNVRGILLVFWQLSVAFGLAAGSLVNVSEYSYIGYGSWRYMFFAAFLPALLLMSLILFSPESPRWLLQESGAKGDEDESHRRRLVQQAYRALVDLRGELVPILAAGEICLMHARLIDEQNRLENCLLGARRPTHTIIDGPTRLKSKIHHIGWRRRVKLFRHSAFLRRAHNAAAAIMTSQQLCGINLLAFLAETFLHNLIIRNNNHATPKQNRMLLGFTVLLMSLSFFATLPTLFLIDRGNGRRKLLNGSFPCMAISLLAAALVLLTPGPPSGAVIAGFFTFLALFVIAYSIGEGPAAFVVSAEVFPLGNRELGMSLAVSWNFMGAGLLAVVAPRLSMKLGQSGVLFLFSGLNLVAWFLCSWLVPDTSNADLESIFEKLDIPTWFMLWYTVRKLRWRVTKPLYWCFHGGSKAWNECGYGEKPRAARDEFEDSQRNRSKANANWGQQGDSLLLRSITAQQSDEQNVDSGP